MFTIIGGTYREVCVSPIWDQLFGSGLRAAAACADMAHERGEQVKLCTWSAASESYELQCRADTYGIELDARLRNDAIEFRYEHPLSRPTVFPAPEAVVAIGQDCICCDTALVFGLLEGNVAVSSKRLVYDPQAGSEAIPLVHTQLQAQDICIVANLTEARSMLARLGVGNAIESATARDAARDLLTREKVTAAIVKNGVYGAWIAFAENIQPIPCFRTDEVFSIGSGDVFSAIFAFLWAIGGYSPATAAENASRATAYYCYSRSLPIPVDLAAATQFFPAISSGNGTKQVYLAGPLFNVSERWFVEETKRCLESLDLSVFSPMHEVGYSDNANTLASADLKGLNDSDLVFAVVDGLDAGTIFEIGYAVAKGKPVIAYGERVSESDLTMLVGTGIRFFRDYATALYQAAWTAASL